MAAFAAVAQKALTHFHSIVCLFSIKSECRHTHSSIQRRGNGSVLSVTACTRALVGLFSAQCCSARLKSSMMLGGALWAVAPVGGLQGPSRTGTAPAPAPAPAQGRAPPPAPAPPGPAPRGRVWGWKGVRWSWSIPDVSRSAVTPRPGRLAQDPTHQQD